MSISRAVIERHQETANGTMIPQIKHLFSTHSFFLTQDNSNNKLISKQPGVRTAFIMYSHYLSGR